MFQTHSQIALGKHLEDDMPIWHLQTFCLSDNSSITSLFQRAHFIKGYCKNFPHQKLFVQHVMEFACLLKESRNYFTPSDCVPLIIYNVSHMSVIIKYHLIIFIVALMSSSSQHILFPVSVFVTNKKQHTVMGIELHNVLIYQCRKMNCASCSVSNINFSFIYFKEG